MFQEDVELLTCPNKPTYFYNGTIQKMVPVFCRRFVSIADKAERNILTGTTGCTSDSHRCFSVCGKINTPKCLLPKVQAMKSKELKGKKSFWGWSEDCIDRQGSADGATLPACRKCRRWGLKKLEILFDGDDDNPTDVQTPCSDCTDWDLLPTNSYASLDFPQHKDYPTRMEEGSPVPPPKGRDTFKEGQKLPFIQLSWAEMTQASKFAFYQATRPKRAWTKLKTKCYLTYCGVSSAVAGLVHDTAKAVSKAKQQAGVN